MVAGKFLRLANLSSLFAAAFVLCGGSPSEATAGAREAAFVSAGLLPTNARPHARPVIRESEAARVFFVHQRALRDSVVRLALAQVGLPYSFGGSTPDEGFDCSGLVQYVFAHLQLSTPRLAARQARSGTQVRRDRLRPGDVLAFGTGDSVTHVGIYIGGQRFVHASSVARRVIVSPVDRPPSPQVLPLQGIRRILTMAEVLERQMAGS